ncbi:MAG: hypothetical protein ACREM1_12950 [Longimicrobiales bacterium]
MRTYAIRALLLALTAGPLAGCSDQGPENTVQEVSGTCTSLWNPPPVPPAGVHRQIDVGVCELTPFGRVLLAGELEIDFAAGTQTGTRTFTIIGGDELHTEVVGGSSIRHETTVSFSSTFRIVGGTGRFTSATGELGVEGVADFTTTTSEAFMSGTVSY